jgi:DNA-binding transcriptional regulator YdaS (Cro superfamily)
MAQLTLNESAAAVVKILADMQERAPAAVNIARAVGGQVYFEAMCPEMDIAPTDLLEQHRVWLVAVLDDDEALALAERFVARARKVGAAALVKAGLEELPWYG